MNIRGVLPGMRVAIVGTRTPTQQASMLAFETARSLAEQGVSIVSGLALGIDASAHRGALAGGGCTVAVLGHGLDMPIYPKPHAGLSEAILRRGALVSPFNNDTGVIGQRLLERNRWIARLSSAIWVVQSAVPGGALAAASHARKMGIPVFTTPWEDEKFSIGYKSLMKHGAIELQPSEAVEKLKEIAESLAETIIDQGTLAW
ncbi:MAG: DNA-processing protein DprA [bacterium]